MLLIPKPPFHPRSRCGLWLVLAIFFFGLDSLPLLFITELTFNPLYFVFV